MSPQSAAYKAYNQAFHTVSKTRQVVMLYDGAIRFLKQAREAMEEKRISDRFRLLVRVSDIVLGLQASLDFEQGGDVARTLYDFYSSVDARLLALHRTNDATQCDLLIQELKDMREAWAAIDQDGGANAAPCETFVEATAPLPAISMPHTSPPAALPFASDFTA